MTLAATVLIPTHDHGPTLLRSVRSALGQTVEDLEVFVVGDGVPDATREVMGELTGSDDRGSVLRQPERAPARRAPPARGAPGSARRDRLLPVRRRPLASGPRRGDAETPRRGRLRPCATALDRRRRPVPPLPRRPRPSVLVASCCSAARTASRSLAARTRSSCIAVCRPGGGRRRTRHFTDLYMWQQILAVPGSRAVSGTAPTVLHFPSSRTQGLEPGTATC